MTGDLKIARCTDATVLAAIHRDTVAQAYSGFFPAEVRLPSLGDFCVTWEQRLAAPGSTAFVAIVNDLPAGLAAIACSEHESSEGELVGLFVHPNRWHHGIGTALHDTALRALAQGGVSSAGLWVIAANSRARGFYESRGWALVPGAQLQEYPGVPEVRMVATALRKG